MSNSSSWSITRACVPKRLLATGRHLRKEECGTEQEVFVKRLRINSPLFWFLIIFAISLALISSAESGDRKPIKPSPKDKCPVCGMFVAKYPDFLAEILFKDGSYAIFDGTKDLFKYYFNLKKYSPSKNLSDIDSIYVTDYYSLGMVDGLNAFYVSGSNVFGPMGKELIAFEKEADAKEFLKDHKGKALLKFNEITGDLIKGLDE